MQIEMRTSMQREAMEQHLTAMDMTMKCCPQFHKELAIMFDDPFERAEEERLELEREDLRQCEIRKQE